MSVLALDPSLTCIGWAHTWNGAPEVGTYKPQGRGVARLEDASGWLKDLLTLGKPDLVLIEGYSFASRGRAVVSIGELGGVLRLTIYRAGIPWVEVPPSCRAKFATGKGNASKDQVLAEAIRRFGYDGHSPDEADALVILHMALHRYDLPRATKLPLTHLAGLHKVPWVDMEGAA